MPSPTTRKQRAISSELHERLGAEAHRRYLGIAGLAERLISEGLDRLEGLPWDSELPRQD